jgi:hypothetical protein
MKADTFAVAAWHARERVRAIPAIYEVAAKANAPLPVVCVMTREMAKDAGSVMNLDFTRGEIRE